MTSARIGTQTPTSGARPSPLPLTARTLPSMPPTDAATNAHAAPPMIPLPIARNEQNSSTPLRQLPPLMSSHIAPPSRLFQFDNASQLKPTQYAREIVDENGTIERVEYYGPPTTAPSMHRARLGSNETETRPIRAVHNCTDEQEATQVEVRSSESNRNAANAGGVTEREVETVRNSTDGVSTGRVQRQRNRRRGNGNGIGGRR